MKNSEYWKIRFAQLEKAQNNIAQETLKTVEQQYREAIREIEGKINTWYQRLAANNNVSMTEARKMLSASELKEFKWDVNDYIKYGRDNALNGKWVKQLENASAKFHISKYEALKIQTQQSLETLFAKQVGTVSDAMKNVYTSGYYHTAFEIQKGVGIGWDISGINQAQLDRVIAKPWAVDGKNFSERLWGNKDKLISEVHKDLTQNIIMGGDPQKAIDSIAKKMNVSKNVAGRLVMTEEAYFSSAAQKDCFNDLDVEEYEIVATLDSLTSEICQEMDGKHFPMKEFQAGVTAPPFHPWCRSTTCPYFSEDFGSVGERAARGEDGKTYYVPADTTYRDWKNSFVDGGDKNGFKEYKEMPSLYDWEDELTISENNDIIKTSRNDNVLSVKDTFDFDELRHFMKEKYDIDVKEDVTKLDFNSVKKGLVGIESVISEYPELGNVIKSIETFVDSEAPMAANGYVIVFNSKKYKIGNNLSKIYSPGKQKKGWITNISLESMGAHEAGHCVERLLINYNTKYVSDKQRHIAWETCVESQAIVEEAVRNIQKTKYGKGREKEKLISAISENALRNPSEALAEAFQDVYANGKEANLLSVEIKKITMEKFNQYKGRKF